MANEQAWGAALQSLGGSVSDYYKQKLQEQVQAEKDRKLAEAILVKEQRDIVNKTLAQQLEGRTIMRREQPGVSYPLPLTPQQQLGPVALPAPDPYDYLSAITTPTIPARPATLSEIPGVVQSYYGRQEVPDYYLTPKEPKPMTAYQEWQKYAGEERLKQAEERMDRQQSLRADTKLNSMIRLRQNMSTDLKSYTDAQRDQMDNTIKNYMKLSGITLADMPSPEEIATPEEYGFWNTIKNYIGWQTPARAEPISWPSTTIRVRIGNKTGTINSNEFDPKTMVRI